MIRHTRKVERVRRPDGTRVPVVAGGVPTVGGDVTSRTPVAADRSARSALIVANGSEQDVQGISGAAIAAVTADEMEPFQEVRVRFDTFTENPYAGNMTNAPYPSPKTWESAPGLSTYAGPGGWTTPGSRLPQDYPIFQLFQLDVDQLDTVSVPYPFDYYAGLGQLPVVCYWPATPLDRLARNAEALPAGAAWVAAGGGTYSRPVDATAPENPLDAAATRYVHRLTSAVAGSSLTSPVSPCTYAYSQGRPFLVVLWVKASAPMVVAADMVAEWLNGTNVRTFTGTGQAVGTEWQRCVFLVTDPEVGGVYAPFEHNRRVRVRVVSGSGTLSVRLPHAYAGRDDRGDSEGLLAVPTPRLIGTRMAVVPTGRPRLVNRVDVTGDGAHSAVTAFSGWGWPAAGSPTHGFYHGGPGDGAARMGAPMALLPADPSNWLSGGSLTVVLEECSSGPGGYVWVQKIEPSYEVDLTPDVLRVTVDRTADADPTDSTTPLGNYAASTLQVDLDNTDGRWSPFRVDYLSVAHQVEAAVGVVYTNRHNDPAAVGLDEAAWAVDELVSGPEIGGVLPSCGRSGYGGGGGDVILYAWTATADASPSTETINGVETRRNEIANPAPTSTGWAGITSSNSFTSGHLVATVNGVTSSSTGPRSQVTTAAGSTVVTPGAAYYLRAEVRHSRGVPMEVRPWFMLADGTYVLYHVSPTVTGTSSWVPVVMSGTVPATAVRMGYQFVVKSNLVTSEIGDVYEVRNITTDPGAYFDGDTPDVVPVGVPPVARVPVAPGGVYLVSALVAAEGAGAAPVVRLAGGAVLYSAPALTPGGWVPLRARVTIPTTAPAGSLLEVGLTAAGWVADPSAVLVDPDYQTVYAAAGAANASVATETKAGVLTRTNRVFWPSAEPPTPGGTIGWSGYGSTFTTSAEESWQGTSSFKAVVSLFGSNRGIVVNSFGMQSIPEGVTVQLTGRVKAGPGNSGPLMSGAFLLRDQPAALTYGILAPLPLVAVGNGWYEFTTMHTVPTGRTLTNLYVCANTAANQTSQVGDTFYFDGIYVGEPGAYFDASTPPADPEDRVIEVVEATPAGVFYVTAWPMDTSSESVSVSAVDALALRGDADSRAELRRDVYLSDVITDLALEGFDIPSAHTVVPESPGPMPWLLPADTKLSTFMADLAKAEARSLYLDGLGRLVAQNRQYTETEVSAEYRQDNAATRLATPLSLDMIRNRVNVVGATVRAETTRTDVALLGEATPPNPATWTVNMEDREWLLILSGQTITYTLFYEDAAAVADVELAAGFAYSRPQVLPTVGTRPLVNNLEPMADPDANVGGGKLGWFLTTYPTFATLRLKAGGAGATMFDMFVPHLRFTGVRIQETPITETMSRQVSVDQYGDRPVEVTVRLVTDSNFLGTVGVDVLETWSLVGDDGAKWLPDLQVDALGDPWRELGDRVLAAEPVSGIGGEYRIVSHVYDTGHGAASGFYLRQVPSGLQFMALDVDTLDGPAVLGY